MDGPWEIIHHGHNLSAYERKRVYLNVRGRDFLDISYLSGADSDGDGRSVVAGDFRNNGQLDLVVRQVGGGALLLYENCFPRRHYLEVSLRGRRSNRQGIGARLSARTGAMSVTWSGCAGLPSSARLGPFNDALSAYNSGSGETCGAIPAA